MHKYGSIRASFLLGVSYGADTGITPLLLNVIQKCVINFPPGAKYLGRIPNIHRKRIIDKINL
jgi:hypothetical protein